MDKKLIKLESDNRISMPMELYERIKAYAFCKECGRVIDVCDCAKLTKFAKKLSKTIKQIASRDGAQRNLCEKERKWKY